MNGLSGDDELDAAYNRVLSVLLDIPQAKRLELLSQISRLHNAEKRKRRAEMGLADGRGRQWKDPEKRAQMVEAIKEGRARARLQRKESAMADM